MTSELVNNVAQAVEQTIPNSPAVQIGEAVVNTVADPSIPVLVEDLMLIHSLATEIKTKLAGKHPALKDMFHWLLSI